jgi:hypothetical protein
MDSEELVRGVSDCKIVGDAFSSGFLIAWPIAFVSYFLPFNILEFIHVHLIINYSFQFYFTDLKERLILVGSKRNEV